MKKNPYSFPHRSRKAMLEYLFEGRKRHHGSFQWNVKAYDVASDGNALRTHVPDLDPARDSAWDTHVDETHNLFGWACEDAARVINDDEWSSYPGDDQGEWDFAFAGRSSGWLVLRLWRGRNMTRVDGDDLRDWGMDDLRAFYRGIRTADSDFTPEKAAAAVTYQLAFMRKEWEETQCDDEAQEIADFVEQMESERPDLTPSP